MANSSKKTVTSNPLAGMSDDEVRAAYTKLMHQREEQKRKAAERRKDPAVKAKLKTYAQKRREKIAAIIERARELGLDK